MNLVTLVLVNLGRNKRRTILTFLSVAVALFLFSALGGVLDTLDKSIKVGSESRLVTRNAISLVFPMPLSYQDRILAHPDVENVSRRNWFGGQDPKNPQNFFAQFAIEGDKFFPIMSKDIEISEGLPAQVDIAVPEGVDPKLSGFMADQTGAVVGEKLMQDQGWELGQTVTLAGTIFPGEWPFTIQAVYRPINPAIRGETLFFHWKYLSEKGMGGGGAVGTYVLQLNNPDRAATIATEIDAMFENSEAATRTETEQAFSAGFVSMYGNIPFVVRFIGMAVVFAILLVAANTMVMAIRERTSEIGVLKTLGFDDGTIFRIVLAEAAIITVSAGAIGTLGAKFLLEGGGFDFGGFLPPMSIYWSTVLTGIGIAALVGAVSGLVPAWQAAQLKIVDAFRRVD